MSVDKDLAYDAWRLREPDPDYEGEARERWEEGLEMIDVLGAETASYLLWEAYIGNDIKKALDRCMDEAWEEQKRNWSEP